MKNMKMPRRIANSKISRQVMVTILKRGWLALNREAKSELVHAIPEEFAVG
jgi:hypothetical protein